MTHAGCCRNLVFKTDSLLNIFALVLVLQAKRLIFDSLEAKRVFQSVLAQGNLHVDSFSTMKK